MNVAHEFMEISEPAAATGPVRLDVMQVLESLDDGAMVLEARPDQLVLVHLTRRLRGWLGLDPDKPIALTDVLTADSAATILESLLAHGEFRGDCTVHASTGDALWGHVVAKMLDAGDPLQPRHAIATVTDVTARRGLESLLDDAPSDTVVFDRNMRVRWLNARSAKFLGLPPEQILGRSWFDLWPGASERRPMYERALAGERLEFPLLPVTPPEGGVRYIATILVPMHNAAGAVTGIAGFGRDVTPWVDAEQARRHAEARFEALAESAQDMICVMDASGRFSYANAAVRRWLGWEPAALIGSRAFDYVHPDDLSIAQERFASLRAQPGRSTGAAPFRYRAQHADGSWRWVEVVATNALASPVINGVLFHSRDVTDRQRAETELTEARAQLELAMSAGRIGIWNVDVVRQRAISEMMYIDLEDRPQRNSPLSRGDWRGRIHPDDLSRVDWSMFESISDVAPWGEVEIRLRMRDGSWHWCLVRGRVTERLADGSPARLDGIVLDIDRRRRMEQALAASEFRYRTVAALTPGFAHETALATDGTLQLTWVSEGARDVFGCEPTEVIARGWPHFLVESNDPAYPQRIARYLSGEPQKFETSIRDVRGQLHRLRVANRPVRHPETGVVTGVVGVIHDVTEETRLQQEILEISHREQQRIGNDLHDGLGQELTGAAMLLREITTRVRSESPDIATRIDDVIGLVNGAIEGARLLARGLSPVGLVGGSLVEALRELARTASARFGIDVSFRSMSPATPEVDDATAVHLYRIAQEAVSNAVRHGQAERVRITLSGGGIFQRLSIRDHGAGMPPQERRSPGGMGLKIMAYRASMIGGAISIQSRGQRGVLVRCNFPQRLSRR